MRRVALLRPHQLLHPKSSVSRENLSVGRRLGATVIALAAIVTLGVVCATHVHDIGRAFTDVPAWALASAVALHLATLALRSEAWRMTLPCDGRRLPRRTVHLANAGAFLAGTLSSHATLPARVALLKRFAGARAPGSGQICVADVPILALELCMTALVLAVGVTAGSGPWWAAPGALGLALVVLVGARMAPELFARRQIFRGLAALADRRRRRALAALVASLVALTLARVSLVLSVCGLPHGVAEVATVFVAMGVFGLLPIGPGASPGATLAAFGGESVGAAVAAGLMLSASSIVAVAAYVPLVVLGGRLRGRAGDRLTRRGRAGRAAASTSRSRGRPSPAP